MGYSMTTIGSYEAKTRLAEFLERVSRGERITITRYGEPIAMLVPADPHLNRDTQSVIASIVDFRAGRSMSPGEARELIDAGRKR